MAPPLDPDISPKHPTWKIVLGRAVRWGLWAFVLVNFYALSLRLIPPPATLLMGQRLLSGHDVRKNWTPLSRISPHMVEAVLAGEDGRFCEHNGLDFDAIKTAYQEYQDGARLRGGSTITQQTAKNVFFWNGGGLARKAGEAWFASLIDFAWGKRRVMEVYLNVAEWGDGIFGVEMAAQERFGVSAKDLNAAQASLLAAVLPSPHKWRLDPPGPYVTQRAGTLRQRMAVIRNSGYDACVFKSETTHSKRPTPQPRPSEPELTPDVKDQPETAPVVTREDVNKSADTENPPKDEDRVEVEPNETQTPEPIEPINEDTDKDAGIDTTPAPQADTPDTQTPESKASESKTPTSGTYIPPQDRFKPVTTQPSKPPQETMPERSEENAPETEPSTTPPE